MMNDYYMIGEVLMCTLSAVGAFVSVKKMYKPCKEFYSKHRDLEDWGKQETKWYLQSKEPPKKAAMLIMLPVCNFLLCLSCAMCSSLISVNVDETTFLLFSLAVGLWCMVLSLIQSKLVITYWSNISKLLAEKKDSDRTFFRDNVLPVFCSIFAALVPLVLNVLML